MRKSYQNFKTRKKSNFDLAGKVLENTFRKYGLDDRIAKYKFVLHWPSIMGEAIAKRSRPEYIRDKTLYIRVADSAWAQELTFQKAIIIKRLEKFLENNFTVTDIRFFVGEV